MAVDSSMLAKGSSTLPPQYTGTRGSPTRSCCSGSYNQLEADEGQYLKGYRYNILLLEVARLGFEPRSPGSKPDMMDPYTIGL